MSATATDDPIARVAAVSGELLATLARRFPPRTEGPRDVAAARLNQVVALAAALGRAAHATGIDLSTVMWFVGTAHGASREEAEDAAREQAAAETAAPPAGPERADG